jgi:hypothetical protein
MLVSSNITNNFDWMLTRDSGTRRSCLLGLADGGDTAGGAVSVGLVIDSLVIESKD